MISRRGGRPGLLGTVARTAVIAGTAQTTANAVNRRGQQRAAAAAPVPAAAPPVPPAPQAPPAPWPPPAPAAAAPGEEVDLVTQLSRLAQLRDSGVLTEAEFQAAKSRILA